MNFVRAQRVIQLSAAYRCGQGRARMIPVDFCHAPSAKKPKRGAEESQWSLYREHQKQMNLSVQGQKRLSRLREILDRDQEEKRNLWVVVDGSFTNAKMLKSLPHDTLLIGRIRKDAKLYHLPNDGEGGGVGRRRLYGKRTLTPEQLQKNQADPWQRVQAYAAGRYHDFRIKVHRPLRWRNAGGQQNLQLIVVAPLAYRLSKNGRILYRQPAYLICTNPSIPAEDLLQAYLWRWDIETNFRDEKTILGVGEAQVRNKISVERVPSLAVAAYSALLMAGIKAFGCEKIPDALPLPKWQSRIKKRRASTYDYIRELRRELWAKAIHQCNFSSFMNTKKHNSKPQKLNLPIHSALFYATG